MNNSTATNLTTRNATLADLAELLQHQHGRKVDVVAPADKLRAEDGLVRVIGAEPIIDADGVMAADGIYRPTDVFDEGVSDKLGIPLAYLRKLRTGRPDMWDANVNGWLHGRRAKVRAGDQQVLREAIPGDGRSFLLRCFRGDGGVGVARAFLSDRYGIVDHLDGLTAALDGVKAAGVEVDITSCDLTDRRMYVAVSAPQISAYAPDLLAGYRSPFGGQDVGAGWTPDRVARAAGGEGQAIAAGDEPIVFAGFVISNSETGGGAFTITPRLVVKVCNNGLTITADALRAVHLGGRLDAGVIRWSEDTARKTLALVTAKTRDAVRTFLDVDYVRRQVDKMTEAAGRPVLDPAKTVEAVSKRLAFTEAQRATVLAHFIKGGQMTAGGVMQAVTSAAQVQGDADAQYDMEASALRVLELAAAIGGAR